MSHRFAIDSLAVRGGRISGWGWLLDDSAAALDIHLRWRGADGMEHGLRCPQLGSRPDLASAFPALPHAAGGGFMLHGRIPPDTSLDASLHARLADGRVLSIPLNGFPGTLAVVAPLEGRWSKLRRHLRGGDWAAASRMIAEAGRRRWSSPRARLRHFLGHPLGTERVLVFDHAMGGGTNHFRQERIAEWRAAGNEVVLVTPDLVSLDYLAHAMDGAGNPMVHRFDDLSACLTGIGAFNRVIVNDLVSFDDPILVLRWTLSHKAAGAHVCFYLHDFHAACPAWTLTADTGRDCGIPDLAVCAACLPANAMPFLGLLPSLDLAHWRGEWAGFLAACDEIVAFSPSSLRLLRKAHPTLALDQARVEPHDLSYIGAPPVPFCPALDGPTTIAVVGNISLCKGAGIVREMAAIIETEGVPARIVVIGSLDGAQSTAALHLAGPYTPAELPAILAREGVTVALLPSIVHETFSYVTSELMHFGVPLAVFDLGAPAERVRDYPLGCIVPAVDARAALDALITLHHRLAANRVPAATAGCP